MTQYTNPPLNPSINHCTMTTPLEHIFNNIIQIPWEVFIPNREALHQVQQEMRRLTDNDELKIETPPEFKENIDK